MFYSKNTDRIVMEENVVRMRIRKSWFLLGLLCILLTVPVFQSMAAGSGTVKNRRLNVRSSASTSSSIVCKLSQGTKVKIGRAHV